MPNRPGLHGHQLPDGPPRAGYDDDRPDAPGHDSPIDRYDRLGQPERAADPDKWVMVQVTLPNGSTTTGFVKAQAHDVHGWWCYVEYYRPTHYIGWIHSDYLERLEAAPAHDPGPEPPAPF